MKIVKKKSTENCHFYSREKSLYIAWACFRNDMAAVDERYVFFSHVMRKPAFYTCENKGAVTLRS